MDTQTKLKLRHVEPSDWPGYGYVVCRMRGHTARLYPDRTETCCIMCNAIETDSRFMYRWIRLPAPKGDPAPRRVAIIDRETDRFCLTMDETLAERFCCEWNANETDEISWAPDMAGCSVWSPMEFHP